MQSTRADDEKINTGLIRADFKRSMQRSEKVRHKRPFINVKKKSKLDNKCTELSQICGCVETDRQ